MVNISPEMNEKDVALDRAISINLDKNISEIDVDKIIQVKAISREIVDDSNTKARLIEREITGVKTYDPRSKSLVFLPYIPFPQETTIKVSILSEHMKNEQSDRMYTDYEFRVSTQRLDKISIVLVLQKKDEPDRSKKVILNREQGLLHAELRTLVVARFGVKDGDIKNFTWKDNDIIF